ncbi:TetR family transcriptional regulator [Streptomyces sp. NPDC004539]|uniref:acyl-CoA-like ligand-binding transcription factor n=1 Tax=Streptomyces sp. NPDC004539 TaxID=3154280 RepID=UPI0033A2F34F
MTPSTSSPAPGGGDLRDRRRRQTAQEIHQAVIRLAKEHGFCHVTVDMISTEAGVSPRTFFNYFPGKEAAAVGQAPAELPGELVARFVAAGPAHPRTVLQELTSALVAHLAEDPPDRRAARDVFELAHSTPPVLAALMTRFDGFRRSLVEAVAARMGPDTPEELPDLIATVAISAMRTGMERWSLHAEDGDSPVPYVERATALLYTLFSPDPGASS